MKNTCFDDLKEDIKNINEQIIDLYETVKNIMDNGGFNLKLSKKILLEIKHIARMIKRIKQNMNSLCDYATDSEVFLKLNLRLDELYSILSLLEVVNRKKLVEICNNYIEDVISITTYLCKRIKYLSVLIGGEDISQEELVILKRQQNRLHLVPEKFDTI